MTGEATASAARNLGAASWLIDQAAEQGEHECVQILTGSATFWLASTGEILRQHLAGVARDRYLSAVDSTPGGRTLAGLRLARNEIAHGTNVVVAGQGMEFPLFAHGGTLSFGGRWVTADRLVEAATARGQRPPAVRDIAAYREHVADRQPLAPLRVARDFLSEFVSA